MGFRFLSVQHLKNETVRVAKRFPLTVVVVVLMTVLLSLWIEGFIGDVNKDLILVIPVLALGIPLTLAAHLIVESRPAWLRRYGRLLLAAAPVVLVGYYWWLQSYQQEHNWVRYFHWALYCHLLVAFAPFLRKIQDNGFWSFNYRLFLAFLVSRFFGVFLWVGLATAVFAIQQLFNILVSEDVWQQLAVGCLVLVASIHFLALVPHNFHQEVEEPRLLKIFCQYVLVPLNVVYILILYAFMGKIFATGIWPHQTISLLVSGVAILGVFALLMMHRFAQHEENRWMRTFQTAYFISVIPLLVMAVLAVSFRVEAFGVTEKRAAIIGLSVWLIGIALYQLISRSKRILWIPISLFAVSLVTSFGPWGFYQLSVRSQGDRLTKILQETGSLKNGLLLKPVKPLSLREAQEVRGTLRYLVEQHGSESLPSELPAEFKAELAKAERGGQPGSMMDGVSSVMLRFLEVPEEFKNSEALRRSEPVRFGQDQPSLRLDPGLVYITVMNSRGSFIDVEKQRSLDFVIDGAMATLKDGDKLLLKWDLQPLLQAEAGAGAEKPRDHRAWTKKNEQVEVFLVPATGTAVPSERTFRDVQLHGVLLVRFL